MADRGEAVIAHEHAREGAESIDVGAQHPALQALLKHATACARCAAGVRCVTRDVLVKTLCEASGKDA